MTYVFFMFLINAINFEYLRRYTKLSHSAEFEPVGISQLPNKSPSTTIHQNSTIRITFSP